MSPGALLGLALLGVGGCYSSATSAPTVPSLPTLQHLPRSDWASVKDGCGDGPKAIGDGKSDDTAALQACFSSIGNMSSSKHTVYLPPGKYIVKETLVLYKVLGGAQYCILHTRPRQDFTRHVCMACRHCHRPRRDIGADLARRKGAQLYYDP